MNDPNPTPFQQPPYQQPPYQQPQYEQPYTPPPAPPSGGGAKFWVLFGAVVALIAANIYLFTQLDKVKTDSAASHTAVMEELAKIRDSSTVTTLTSRKNLDTLRDELETARRQATMAAGQAKADATKRAEDLARKLEIEQQRLTQQTKKEIGEVQQTAAAANTRIGEVSTEVGSVKTEVASTKAELDKTISSLKRVTGDVDGQGSLIATNAKEIGALRALGERNIFEFDIRKQKAPTKVGDITILVKKTDPKKNQYTIEVVADDKKVEKTNKNTNEPVQFYVLSKARQPWEIVVNNVGKDQIKGYLSTPKVQTAR